MTITGVPLRSGALHNRYGAAVRAALLVPRLPVHRRRQWHSKHLLSQRGRDGRG